MNTINWNICDLLEITLTNSDSFLKIAETLTRVGISNSKTKTMYQTCHILHKRGSYYITHFKEMIALDGEPHTITEQDINRRNKITKMLCDWNLCDIVQPELISECLESVHVIKYNDKSNWNLQPKYKIGLIN